MSNDDKNRKKKNDSIAEDVIMQGPPDNELLMDFVKEVEKCVRSLPLGTTTSPEYGNSSHLLHKESTSSTTGTQLSSDDDNEDLGDFGGQRSIDEKHGKQQSPAEVHDSSVQMRGLSSLGDDELRRHLGPIVRALENLDAKTILALQHLRGRGAKLRDGVNVRPIHRLVSTPKLKGDGCIRYLDVAKLDTQYDIGIFVFPPKASIPLHDHPGMCVLSRVLYGDLTVNSFDIISTHHTHTHTLSETSDSPLSSSSSSTSPSTKTTQQQNHTPNDTRRSKLERETRKPSWFSSILLPPLRQKPSPIGLTNPDSTPKLPDGWLLSKQDRARTITAPEMTILFPLKGNVHEFVAGENGAAVLDVLIPPYEPNNFRDCTFYAPKRAAELGIISPTGDTNNNNNNNNNRLYYLEPIQQPESYLCLPGRYGALGHVEDDEEDFA